MDDYSARFWDKVDKTGECWNWTAASRGSTGYGCMKIKRIVYDAHRISYTLTHGKVPEGKWILHKCNNRKCVRPSHLYAGTPKENTRDAIRAGTHHKVDWSVIRHGVGEEIGTSKLKENQVREIMRLKGIVSGRKVCKLFGVGNTTIYRIWNKQDWKHLWGRSSEEERLIVNQ